jgi:SAM-dependent methyltransferase
MRSLDSYGSLCRQFYDLDKPTAPPDALEFYWARCRAAGGPVLEAMCGSGRFLIPLAQRGADIDGFDASPHMLSACRAGARSKSLNPGLYHQFIQDLDLPRTYGFVFVPAGSFALLPAHEQARALAGLARHMRPAAELDLEMWTPAGDGPVSVPAGERSVRRQDGLEIVLRVDATGLMRYDLMDGARVVESELERIELHPRRPSELDALLLSAGFEGIQHLRQFDGLPASEEDLRLVYVCSRSG